MPKSILDSLLLGYQALWGRTRQASAICLTVGYAPDHHADAAHWLRALDELWGTHSPPLLISPNSRRLLHDVLQQPLRNTWWVVVDHRWLSDPGSLAAVHSAHRSGQRLVWRGSTAELPDDKLAGCFQKCLLSLTPDDAALALRARLHDPVALRNHVPRWDNSSPVLPQQWFEGVEDRGLMQHCLDQRDAAGLLGWPSDDVLHGWQHRAMQPSREVINALVRVIDADESLETLEHLMSQDPVLAYRFLAHANSPLLGLQSGIDSVRRALLLVGYTNLRKWLRYQFPAGQDDLDLRPIKAAMVLRAQLMSGLLDAGEDDDLRREVYLCGLFSMMDHLLGVPLGTSVQSLPLSNRIYDATVQARGPYEPCLTLARALEQDNLAITHQLCMNDEFSLEQVNRALLRTLASLYVPSANGERGERRRRPRSRKFG